MRRRLPFPALKPLAAALLPLAFACSGPPAKAPAAAGRPPAAPPGSAQEVAASEAPPSDVEALPARVREARSERVLLDSFDKEGALRAYLAPVVRQVRRERAAERREYGTPAVAAKPVATAAPPAPPAAAASKASSESVTNVQHAGVDEGGIVKVHGDHLVVLRRGRLFTIRVGGGDLRPVFATDAFGPGVDPDQTWYDEMLVVGDTVIVIGFSYNRGGTEIGLFDVDARGFIKHRSTHHLRADDYYSARNYASRVVGDKLVFYSPLAIDFGAPDPLASLPSARRFRPGAGRGGFRRIAAFKDVYHAPNLAPNEDTTLHTVTVCDLKSPAFDCRATTLLGPPGRTFYVAPGAVYVWTSPAEEAAGGPRAHVYRLPLDGGEPTGLKVFGSPIDQFSSLEGDDGHLNVLVQAEGAGDSMWGAELPARGAPALARVPLASFGPGVTRPPVRYALLPAPESGRFQNRFVGDYVLYGTDGGYRGGQAGAERTLFAYPFARGGPASALRLGHDVERIEAMGRDAIVVGGDGQALHFTSVGLGPAPGVAGHYELAGAAQGEGRSHGFFYKPESEQGGLLGLPVVGLGGRRHRAPFSGQAAARVLYLRNDAGRLRELGALASRQGDALDDRCRASCVDWYGDSRPLFLRGRLFALLGYELVEGRLDGDGVREIGRISFAPTSGGR